MTHLLSYISIAIISLCALYIASIVYMVLRGANYVRTPDGVIRLVVGELKPGDTFVDLGAGNGELVIAAANCGAAKAIGYELDVVRYIRTWIELRRTPHADKSTLRFADVWRADLSTADVVYTFFTDIHMKALYQKAKREMKQGSMFISYVHPVPGIVPTRQVGKLLFFSM